MVLNCRNGFVTTMSVLLVMNHYVNSLSPLQIVRDFICMFEFCDIFSTYHRYVDMVHTE